MQSNQLNRERKQISKTNISKIYYIYKLVITLENVIVGRKKEENNST